MEDTKVLDSVVVGIKRAITAKAIISTASIGMLIPFAKLVYWIFDTSYLGGFGVSPDVYSRPIFASGFVSIWLVVESLGPMIVGWSILAFVFFVILTSTNIVPSRKVVINENMDENGMDAISDKQSFRDRVFDFVDRILDAASRSSEWPATIWVAGLSVVLFLSITTIWASEKGNELAKAQRDLYLNKGFCADKFNSSNVGCFTIHGVEGSGHFIIANLKDHLIYLSRECFCEKGCDPRIRLNILEKTPSIQYSIIRDFVPLEKNESSSKEKKEGNDDSEI